MAGLTVSGRGEKRGLVLAFLSRGSSGRRLVTAI